MNVNTKKLRNYGLLMVVGMILIVYGIMDLTIQRYTPEPMSDADIIQRAKDLGMVEWKDVLRKLEEEPPQEPKTEE